MRFPLALTAKIAAYMIGHKLAWHEEVRHRAAARAVAHLQSDLHRLRADSRIFHIAQGHDEPGGLPRGGGGMQRANDLDLRRRAADLPAHRSAGEGLARAKADRLHLHKRHVHAQENARMARIAIVESQPRDLSKRRIDGVARERFDQRERRG